MIPILSLLAVAGFQQPDTALPIHETRRGIRYEFVAADRSLLPSLQMLVEGGRTNAERFFGGRFRAPLIVRIYPNRRALTAHWAAAWGVPDLHVDRDALKLAIEYGARANPSVQGLTVEEFVYEDNKIAKALR